MKKILSPRSNAVPNVSLDMLNNYISEVVRDTDREVPLGPLEGLEPPEEPTIPFKECNLQLAQLNDLVKTRRNASKPGPNQIPYKFYKKCTKTREFLFKIIYIGY